MSSKILNPINPLVIVLLLIAGCATQPAKKEVGSHLQMIVVQLQHGGFSYQRFVFFDKQSGQAVMAASTNAILMDGKIYTASPAQPSRGIFINISQPFGSRKFDEPHAVAFEFSKRRDYLIKSPYRKFLDLEPVLQPEEDLPLAAGTPLRRAQLQIEDGRPVVLFESYTHVKGKVTLDRQLNPVSIQITEHGTLRHPDAP